MADDSISLSRDAAARPDGPSWWYPGAPTGRAAAADEGREVEGSARYARGMDARAVASELTARLAQLGIGHTVEVVQGAQADGVLVRSPYAEPVTVVENDSRFTLVARGSDGGAKLVDTELAAEAPVELLALYLAFHSLWAMKRTVDRHGPEAVARRMPNLLTHQQLVITFIAASLTSPEDGIRTYATGLMTTATNMLRA
ncbi:hypothetical protein GCM10027515_11750 [Schumannella luteola]